MFELDSIKFVSLYFHSMEEQIRSLCRLGLVRSSAREDLEAIAFILAHYAILHIEDTLKIFNKHSVLLVFLDKGGANLHNARPCPLTIFTGPARHQYAIFVAFNHFIILHLETTPVNDYTTTVDRLLHKVLFKQDPPCLEIVHLHSSQYNGISDVFVHVTLCEFDVFEAQVC